MLDIELERSGVFTVLRPRGNLDAFTVSRFRQAFAGIGAEQLVVDLSGVPFLDSAGLGALIGGIRRVREVGGDVAVACPSRGLARLLETTGLDRIVAVRNATDAAFDALASPAEPAASV